MSTIQRSQTPPTPQLKKQSLPMSNSFIFQSSLKNEKTNKNKKKFNKTNQKNQKSHTVRFNFLNQIKFKNNKFKM